MEMAKGSGCSFVIYGEKLPVLKGAKEYAQMGLIPAGAYRNREYLENDVDSKVSELWLEDLFYDPQTSGGLHSFCKKGRSRNSDRENESPFSSLCSSGRGNNKKRQDF